MNVDERQQRKRAAYRKWRISHREQELERLRVYRAANKEQRRAYNQTNAAKIKARWRKWYEGNKPRILATQQTGKGKAVNLEATRRYRERNRAARRAATTKWRQQHPDRHAAKQRLRIARELQAMPAWIEPRTFLGIYAEAARRTSETGIPHHVDHIVPLKGHGVSGLHVPWNLQVIPALENLRKGNRIGSR